MTRAWVTIVLALFCATGVPLVAPAREAVDVYEGLPAPRLTENRRCTDDGRSCIEAATYVADVCTTIERAAADNRLDPNFLARLLWKESLFEPDAVSPVGALGIAQFMPETARIRKLDDPFNPAKAIHASATYLAYLADGFGNIGLAAVAYNGGEGRAMRFFNGSQVLPYETLDVLKADPRFKVIVGTTEGETMLSINNAKAPLDDVRVRKAIALALDRQEIIEGAMFGYGTPIGSHTPPHSPDYVDETAKSPHDPEQAKALLKEARVSDLRLRLALPPPPYARRGGEIVAAELRAVGIETEITNMEWAQWLETVFNGGDFDLTIISHVEPMDLDIYARPDYYIHYAKPDYVALMDKLKAAVDPAERSALVKQAQAALADDYVVAWLFQLAKTGVANAKIEGLWENSPTPANDLTAVRWTE